MTNDQLYSEADFSRAAKSIGFRLSIIVAGMLRGAFTVDQVTVR